MTLFFINKSLSLHGYRLVSSDFPSAQVVLYSCCSSAPPSWEGKYGEKRKLYVYYSGESRLTHPCADAVVSFLRSADSLTGKQRLFTVRSYERAMMEFWSIDTPYSYLAKRPFSYVPKDKFCCFVVSNPHCAKRNRIFERLHQYKPVDSLGRYRRNVDIRVPPRRSREYIELLARYRFIICAENCQKSDYLTEKLYNALLANSIAIYWGDPHYHNIYHPDRVIAISPYSDNFEEELEKAVAKVDLLECDRTCYANYLAMPPIVDPSKADEQLNRQCQQLSHYLIEESPVSPP